MHPQISPCMQLTICNKVIHGPVSLSGLPLIRAHMRPPSYQASMHPSMYLFTMHPGVCASALLPQIHHRSVHATTLLVSALPFAAHPFINESNHAECEETLNSRLHSWPEPGHATQKRSGMTLRRNFPNRFKFLAHTEARDTPK